MNSPLTTAQVAALRAYAAEHGRTWKAQLCADWGSGKCQGELQQVRNIRGPSWLMSVRLDHL
mgnify:CR=1 FL=1